MRAVEIKKKQKTHNTGSRAISAVLALDMA